MLYISSDMSDNYNHLELLCWCISCYCKYSMLNIKCRECWISKMGKGFPKGSKSCEQKCKDDAIYFFLIFWTVSADVATADKMCPRRPRICHNRCIYKGRRGGYCAGKWKSLCVCIYPSVTQNMLYLFFNIWNWFTCVNFFRAKMFILFISVSLVNHSFEIKGLKNDSYCICNRKLRKNLREL